jgi:hypothetical protein
MEATTMRSALIVLIVPLSLALLPGCRKQPPTHPVQHVEGTPHTDQVLSAFRSARLPPDGFVATNPVPVHAVYCEHGTVAGVDTTICEYQDDQTLDKGVQEIKAGWARIDVHTGVVVRAKRTLLTLVDRERREPSGKTISQMVDVFRGL